MPISAKADAFKEMLKWSIAEPQHRYEFQDAHMEVTYRLNTSKEAIARAIGFEAKAFLCRQVDGTYDWIRCIDGLWRHSGGSLLSTVQGLFDHEALFHIMHRLELRAELEDLQSPEIEEMMALADAYAFCRIESYAAQKSAAAVMAVHARSNELYREALKRALPRRDIYGVVQSLSGLALDPDEIPF